MGSTSVQHIVGNTLSMNTLNTKAVFWLSEPNQLISCTLGRGQCAQAETTQRASLGNLIATGNGGNHHVASDLWRQTFFNAISRFHASDTMVRSLMSRPGQSG